MQPAAQRRTQAPSESFSYKSSFKLRKVFKYYRADFIKKIVESQHTGAPSGPGFARFRANRAPLENGSRRTAPPAAFQRLRRRSNPWRCLTDTPYFLILSHYILSGVKRWHIILKNLHTHSASTFWCPVTHQPTAYRSASLFVHQSLNSTKRQAKKATCT